MQKETTRLPSEVVLGLYNARNSRALELREAGQKVVGYFCCYVPLELFTALDLVPYRIQGNVNKPVTLADAYLETTSCSFIRSSFDLALDGYYDFLDGLIVPHTCDTVQRIYEIWRRFRKPGFMHFLNVPHMVQPSSYTFFSHELKTLVSELEALAGKKLEEGALRRAIALHNENRALLRQLYRLRTADAPKIKGSDVLKLIVAGMGMPVVEHNALVRGLIAEVAERKAIGAADRPRLMVFGSELDDCGFLELLEDAGADVVVDDICTGTRSFWPDVAPGAPWDSLVSRYLGDINCPRTYRPQVLPRSADLENRFGYLRQFVQEFRVDGVVLYVIRFCDTHELDAPDVIEYLGSLDVPVFHLEEEYRVANVGQIKTRAEAFLETLGR